MKSGFCAHQGSDRDPSETGWGAVTSTCRTARPDRRTPPSEPSGDARGSLVAVPAADLSARDRRRREGEAPGSGPVSAAFRPRGEERSPAAAARVFFLRICTRLHRKRQASAVRRPPSSFSTSTHSSSGKPPVSDSLIPSAAQSWATACASSSASSTDQGVPSRSVWGKSQGSGVRLPAPRPEPAGWGVSPGSASSSSSSR